MYKYVNSVSTAVCVCVCVCLKSLSFLIRMGVGYCNGMPLVTHHTDHCNGNTNQNFTLLKHYATDASL